MDEQTFQPTEELFEPGEYLDQRGPGYFSILAKPSGRAKQSSYELQHLSTVVKAANPRIDTWITQCVFNRANRRAVNVESVGLLFADLDTYHSPTLTQKTPEEQAELLVAFCAEEGIPAPSIVLFSGRGLQAKWLLTEALGPLSIPDWKAAELALVRLLEPLCADQAAKDVSRVLRLDRTVNTKSGEVCRIVWTASGVETVLARYDFTELAENLTARFPERAESKRSERKVSTRVVRFPSRFSLSKLNWYRLYDLRSLWVMRGGVPIGFREITLFWELNFLLRAEPGKVSDLWKEAEALAAQIDPHSGWYQQSDLSTLYRKAREARAGATVEYQGRTYPPLYTPRNQTLIDLFRITPEEERQLRTIISSAERNRRRREKRWAEGTKPQPYRSSKPWEDEGISRATWYRTRDRE